MKNCPLADARGCKGAAHRDRRLKPSLQAEACATLRGGLGFQDVFYEDSGGVSGYQRVGSYVAEDYAAGGYDCAFAYGYAFQNMHAVADPGVAADADRLDLIG